MDNMTDTTKALRFAHSMSWATLFLSIGVLLVIALSYLSGQTSKDSFSTLTALLLTTTASSLQGIVTNIRWKFVFLAFQLLFLFFAIRFLVLSSNS